MTKTARIKVTSFTDVEQFRKAVEAFLLREEEQNNLLLSLMKYSQGQGRPVFRMVTEDAAILGVAIRVGDERPLVCSQMPAEAAKPLWESLANVLPGIAELNGPAEIVDSLVETSRHKAEMLLHLGAYSSTAVIEPPKVSGRLRLATLADVELLLVWRRAFSLEALRREAPEGRAIIEDKIKRETFYVWEDDRPVCQTYSSAPSGKGIRITGVYTPYEHRCKGYAANCVAAVTSQLLGQGYKTVFLFTDLTNPTSNAIYKKVGFRHFADLKHIKLMDLF